MIPLPRFLLSHEDGEDDAQLLARVKQEARNILGSYTRIEHKACVANLSNNGRLNHVLKVAGVSYGHHPVPISAEVLRKSKADAAAIVWGKRPKVTKKKGVVLVKVSGSRASADLKWPSGVDILLAKSMKLSKGTIPHVIVSVAAARIMPVTRVLKVSGGIGGAKGDGGHPGYTTLPGVKASPSAKKRIIPAIGALVALSLNRYEDLLRMTQRPKLS
jgi:hypothetical protein